MCGKAIGVRSLARKGKVMDEWQKAVYDKMKTFAETRQIIAHKQQNQEPALPVVVKVTQEEAYVIMKAMESAYGKSTK